MDTLVPRLTLYDVLLEAIQFDPDEEVHKAVIDLLSRPPPKQAKKAQRTLSRLLPDIIRLRKDDLLRLLLQKGIVVDGMAVKAAVALPLESAKVYLELLFAYGWDVNKALSNTEPPVLRYLLPTRVVIGLTEDSIALHDTSLTHWLLAMGADPTAACDIDYTPLSVAVRTSALPTVQLLLQHAQHYHNGYLIYYATQRADTDETIRMIKLLHQHKKPVDDILWQDARSYRFRAQFLRGTPLYYACIENKVLVTLTLLDLGADPDKACVRYNKSVGPSPSEIAGGKNGLIAAWPAGGTKQVPST